MNTTERDRPYDWRAMSALGMLVFAGFFVAGGPGVARAQGRDGDASAKPKATPSPSPTCSMMPTAADVDLAIYLKDRDAACFQPAPAPSESPSPCMRPALYVGDDDPDPTCRPEDAASFELNGPLDSNGLTFKYAMKKAVNAVRRINGVPMEAHEHRVTIEIIKVDGKDSYVPIKDPLTSSTDAVDGLAFSRSVPVAVRANPRPNRRRRPGIRQ